MSKMKYDHLIFRIVLFLFPMLHLTLGIDIADVGYSLINFESFPNFNETWMLSTLLAQAIGKLMTFLPFGHTMMGIHFYCLLLLGGCAVLFFELLRKDYKPWVVFVGELLAICLCWSPKYILYQYLTYYLFSIAALLLVKGLILERKRLLFCSGLLLGANLLVRLPNIVETALIVVVLYYAILKKTEFKKLLVQVGVCMAGFFLVALTGILCVELIWGFGSYKGMIEGTFFMTKEATSYTPAAMIKDTLLVYVEYLKWFSCFVVGTVSGYLVYMLLNKKWMKTCFYIVFCGGFLFILRFFIGRGKLTFQYTEYVSVYPWIMFLLILAVLMALYEIFWKKIPAERKVFALMVLCVIAITPIGSNNNVYSNFNNLFIVAPYLFGSLINYFAEWKTKEYKIGKQIRLDYRPAMLMIALIMAVTLIQGVCFGVQFTFHDKAFLAKDKVTVTNNERLHGMQTNADNAQALEGLTVFMKENGYYGKRGLIFGNISMVLYACELQNAVSHAWPSLPSHPTAEYEKEISSIEDTPVVIMVPGEYDSLCESSAEGTKGKILIDFIIKKQYREVYRNKKFVVLVAE